MTRQEALSRGFEAGSYDEAYSGVCCAVSWNRKRARLTRMKVLLPTYEAGYYLGYYSSYEIHEIPSEDQDTVAHLRKTYAVRCERAGIALD